MQRSVWCYAYEVAEKTKKDASFRSLVESSVEKTLIMNNSMLIQPSPPGKHISYIHAALDEARKSSMRFAHGCVVVKRGRVIGQGHNYYTYKYGHKWSTHAEVAAVKSLPTFEDLRGARMYVVRLQRHTGSAVLSHPCHGCTKFLNAMMHRYGLTHVYYTN